MNYRTKILSLATLISLGLGFSVMDGISSQVNATVEQTQKNEVIKNNTNNLLLAKLTDENDIYTGTIQSCTHSGSTVKCGVTVRSNRNVSGSVYCNWNNGVAKLFDSIGNIYECAELQIGNRSSKSWFSSMRFPEGTPVKLTYTFKNVPRQTSQFDTLEIEIAHRAGLDEYFLKFRNIQITE